jgi:RNA polymerase sigma-70 factor (ECF subfamily)
VIQLNRAVAVAMADGPAMGLQMLEGLTDTSLRHNHLFHAARGDLLTRLNRPEEAAAAFRAALAVVGTSSERRFLERRLRELGH